MKKKKVDLRISTRMAEEVCAFYGCTSPSEALTQCVKDALLKHTMHTRRKRHWTPEQTLAFVEQDKARKDQRVSLYLNEAVMESLRGYYCDRAYITDAAVVRCCVYDALNGAVTDWRLKSTDKIFYMVGQKNPQMQAFLNECFADIRNIYRIDGYAEPFTGTANVLLHTAELDAELLSDNSVDLVNLLRIIRDFPYEFKAELLSLDTDRSAVKKYRTDLLSPPCLKAPQSALLRRAAMFWVCRYFSHYGQGMGYRAVAPDAMMKKLDVIHGISERLREVDIKKRDALYFARTLANEADQFLIYFDAPYICSEEYYKHNNAKRQAFSAHTALRNRVQELRTHHICVLNYRITVSASMNKKGISDETLRRKLDQLYLNRGFHFKLKRLKNTNEQIEILLATVPFCGSQPYTTALAETEVICNA